MSKIDQAVQSERDAKIRQAIVKLKTLFDRYQRQEIKFHQYAPEVDNILRNHGITKAQMSEYVERSKTKG